MLDTIIKSVLSISILFFGTSAFAETLNSVEIQTGNTGKIILDTDLKSSIKKTKISQNEIQLELKNTTLAENVKTIYNNTPSYNGISVMQNENDTFVNISGKNIADYELIYASDDSIIPVKNTKKDVGVSTIIGLLTILAAIISKKTNKISLKRKESLRKSLIEHAELQQKASSQQQRLSEMKTLRNKIQNNSTGLIHSNAIAQFATSKTTSGVTIPDTLRHRNYKNINEQELKKVVNS